MNLKKDPSLKISQPSVVLKAGFKEDQTRSSETGQWTGGSGTSKKPKRERVIVPRITKENIGKDTPRYGDVGHNTENWEEYKQVKLFFVMDGDIYTTTIEELADELGEYEVDQLGGFLTHAQWNRFMLHGGRNDIVIGRIDPVTERYSLGARSRTIKDRETGEPNIDAVHNYVDEHHPNYVEYIDEEVHDIVSGVWGKSISLTHFKLKAGYKEDQQRSSETGQWTGGSGGGTAKKPKKETRRTLQEEISSRGGEMNEDFDYRGEFAVDEDVARNLREWENPDLLWNRDGAQTYNDNIYDLQRDYMLGLHGFQLETLKSYTGDAYGAYSNALSDPRFWDWQGSGGDAVYDNLNSKYLRNSFTGAQRLRHMIENSPDISEDTTLYSGTGAEHFLGNLSEPEQSQEYGKMLEEEYQKIGVDFEEAVGRLGSGIIEMDEQGRAEVRRASNLMGNRVADEINKTMKYKGEFSPKRLLSTSVDLKQATHFSPRGKVEHDIMYSTVTRFDTGMGLVPIVIARYKGLKKGLGVAPLTATSRHVAELEVLIGGGTNKMKFVGASYDEGDFLGTVSGTHHGVIYVDFEGVE